MTAASERELTALHEAGHAVISAVFGWRVNVVTIEPGRAAYGCSSAAPPLVPVPADADYGVPFVRWPHQVRQRMEGEALVHLAGTEAELLFAPRVGRGQEPVSVQAAELVATAPAGKASVPEVPAATVEERAAAADMCDRPTFTSDAEKLARLARHAHDADAAAAGTWLAYLETQCRALLIAEERRVRRFADALLATGTLGARASARLLA